MVKLPTMRIINKLWTLQALDSAVLILLLGIITLLTWLSLTDVALKTQQNLQESTTSLQTAHDSFLRQVKLETLIDHQRQAFDTLNEAFFKFTLNPNNDAKNRPTIHKLTDELRQHSQALLADWPAEGNPTLKDDYKNTVGAMTRLADEIDDLSLEDWRRLAIDAHDTANHARQLMENIEELDNHSGERISVAIQHSIHSNVDNTTLMAERLDSIKHNALWVTLLLMVILIISRMYFSTRFQHMTKTAQTAQQVAEEALKTKARFLATMSHEIRTPMNGVIGMTRLLMNTPMSKKQTDFVESIHLSGEHLLTVINDVLDFSKIEAGKLDLKREPLEIRACIEEVLNLLTSKALEKNLELAYAVGPSIPLFIEGDMVRLRQIMTNLIGNAIKFTDSGEITVFVIPRSHKGHEYELEFQINDTGHGIPADRLDSIFEQFNQADSPLSRHNEGTGLGLAISRRLVNMMDGEIWAESTNGTGSRFYFTIKTRKAEGKLKPFLYPNIPEMLGKRILIVENNPANQQALQDFCFGWGAITEAYASSSEAIARIAAGHTYDICLVDSNLPNASVLDFAKYVRSRYSKQELPLILVAPPNDPHPKDIVRELFNLYLTKPITRSRLFDSLMTVLGKLNLTITRPEQSRLKLGERLPLAILLVEDNPINQIVAASILDEIAYKADIAENGLEALTALHKKAYDIIFMDMQMPEMDGLEATRRNRADFPPERQPIIVAMTANAMDGDKQECHAAGMNNYISKPVLPEAVEAVLERWCNTLPVAATQDNTQENTYETTRT